MDRAGITRAEGLLSALEERGLRLWAEGQRLRFEAPRGVVDDDVRRDLSAHKPELLHLLESRRQATDERVPLTTMQEAYWVGETASLPLSTSARYYFEVTLGSLPDGVLDRALAVLVARHQILRATIAPAGHLRILQEAPTWTPVVHLLGPEDARTGRDEIRRRMLARRRAPRAAAPRPVELEVSRAPGSTCLHFDLSLWALDGASLRCFLRELLGLLHPRAAPAGGSPDYRAYVQSEALRRGRRDTARAWAYWRPRLDAFPGGPPLPLARKPEDYGEPRFVRRSFTLDPATASRLGQNARRAGVSPTFAMCAAYSEVLARFGGSKHFTITVLHSDRGPGAGEGHDVLGNFGRTVLLEVDRSERAPFASHARALQAQFWRDLQHGAVSGVDVSREISRRRGLVGGAAFPVTFTVVPPLLPGPAENPHGAAIDHARCHLQVPQVHLDHQVCEGPAGELTFNWDVVADLFPDGMVATMFAAYRRRLEALADDESAWTSGDPPRLCQAPPPPATVSDVPGGSIHDGFLRQAAEHPERTAVITPHVQLTYGDLHARAVGLARRLESMGVAPGALVAVVMEKGWEQIVAVLGILMAGATYVPVDPELPAPRRALVLADAGVTAAVTQPALRAKLDWPAQVTPLALSSDDPVAASAGPPRRPREGDLAYVIFTSGTTGKPKGVMIEHRAALNTIADINARIGIGPGDRVFGISSLSFDLSVYDIFGTLSAGAALVLPAHTREPAHWRELIDAHAVTVWSSVPSIVQVLEESARVAARPLDSLRVVMMSGDWIPLSLPPLLRKASRGIRLVSLGGATEASIWSNIYEIGEVSPLWRTVPYGRALTNQSMHVLDDALDLCDPLVPGDIYIGGVGLARGYLADRERTEAAFLQHPLTQERLYRTGDRGRYRPDGEIELLGREDHQVKIQGYRIECAEIEAALFTVAELSAAAVTAMTDAQGARQLVAHIAARAGAGQPSPSEITRRLREILPAYMVPAAVVWIEALPVTPNGKVDRGRLPVPAFAAAEAPAAAPRPARDAVEERLLSLWSELLPAPVSSVDDDFFAHGGTSFTGMRLMTQIEGAFGRRLPLSTLIQRPTVGSLAELLRAPQTTVQPVGLVPLRGGDRAEAIVCVHPVGGNVLCYRELAQRLRPGPAVLGIQSPALLGGAPPRDIQSMASAYVAALRVDQPRGPYRLCGWSLGGVIAYEMARQLAAAAQDVVGVALIDSPFPSEGGRESASSDAELMVLFVRDLLAIAGCGAPLAAEAFAGTAPERLGEQALAILSANAVRPFATAGDLQTAFSVFAAHLRALHAYRPGPYAGAVALFAADRDGTGRAHTRRWSEVAPRARTVLLDGDHYSVMAGQALTRVASGMADLMNLPEER